MTAPLGICAALASPLMISIGLVLWDQKWTGHAVMLNLYKCVVASVGFIASVLVIVACGFTSSVLEGADGNDEARGDVLFGGEVPASVWFYLGLSATIGVTLGDCCQLQALKQIGARRTILVDSLRPFVGTMLGACLLQETGHLMNWQFVGGLALTSLGVCCAAVELEGSQQTERLQSQPSSEQSSDDMEPDAEVSSRGTGSVSASLTHGAKVLSSTALAFGYMCAILSVTFDNLGSALTKQHSRQLNAIEIPCTRFIVAALTLGTAVASARATTIMRGKSTSIGAASYVRLLDEDASFSWRWYEIPNDIPARDWVAITVGIFFVTFLAPIFSTYALFQMPVGAVQSLTSIGPLYSIPVVMLIKGETVSVRGLLGAAIAVAGVFLLCYSVG